MLCFSFYLSAFFFICRHHHHQQPYHSSKPLVHGNDIRLITFADGEYRPAVGEILVQDSILYSQKPETRLLRRQLWPIMQETMDTLVDSVTAGANLFKNMLVTNPNPIATKIRNIKNAYISAATSTVRHKKLANPPMKKVKKMKKIPESVRTKTVSEDYVHTYNDEVYTVPTYVVKSGSKNPYSQMGLKDYKHFEETVLRELEEKEEKKVEATMGSFYKHEIKNIEEELVQGIPNGGWKPVKPDHVKVDHSHHINNPPKQVGKLHTNFAASEYKPIHEVVDESRTISHVHEAIIEQPVTNSFTKSRRKPNNNRPTTTVSPPRPFTRNPTKEEPNYPEYFLNKHKGATKDNQNSQGASQELNYIKRMKFYREHMQGLTTLTTSTSTTNRPPNARDSLLNDASEEKFVFITPMPKLANDKKMQRTNRQKTKVAVDGNNSEKSSIGNRGSIKFGDSI